MNTEKLTEERGRNYGHPYDHFRCTKGMYDTWRNKRSVQLDKDLENCLHHIIYMICDKMARAAENPMHMDNWEDMQGYASLWKKCLERADLLRGNVMQ